MQVFGSRPGTAAYQYGEKIEATKGRANPLEDACPTRPELDGMIASSARRSAGF
jgi:hypothetical protein